MTRAILAIVIVAALGCGREPLDGGGDGQLSSSAAQCGHAAGVAGSRPILLLPVSVIATA